MSVSNTVSVSPPLESRPLASVAAGAVAIPWTIWLTVAGIMTFLVGTTIDGAWHKSVGRDEFWTPGHTMMGVGGLMMGIAALSAILAMTRAASPTRDLGVRVLGLRGPGGAFLIVWSVIAMLCSSPFDDWWHKTYGLDLNLITPPHLLLIIGWFTAQIGALLWLASWIGRSTGALQKRFVWLFLFAGGVLMIFSPTLSYVTRRNHHSSVMYLAVALAVPATLIATGRASRQKWGCTLVAAIFMALVIVPIWVLPLFPAQPKVGPVYQQVTHLIPGQFPLLLIVPAFFADLLLQRLESRSSWFKALLIGPAFVLSLLLVQWPFANFLMSPASRNWIFGTGYLPYYVLGGAGYNVYQFAPPDPAGTFVVTILVAMAGAILTTRFGLAWGDWMRRIRR